MKIAELPDGQELYFPDDYEDDKMDQVVLRYIQLQTQQTREQVIEMRLLRKSIEQGVNKITTIMAAPKELIRDWKDKPVGVKPKI